MDTADRQRRIEMLTEVNLDDLCDGFGLKSESTNGLRGRSEQARVLARVLLRRAGRPTAARFARLMADLDASAGRLGMRAGAAWGLGALQTSLRVVGGEAIPASGPVLFLSNHPGMGDTLALFSAIPREGLRTIAARRRFLELLPNMSAPLFWVDEDEGGLRRVAGVDPGAAVDPGAGRSGSRMAAVRAAATHLRAGGALLTFPAGQIEPDPAVWPNAEETLADWNASMDLFARLVPNLVVVPTLVSGVISARAAHSPLRAIRRTRDGKDLLSAMLQIAWPPFRGTAACVRFGQPMAVAALATPTGSAPPVVQMVTTVMRTLIAAERRERAAGVY